MIRKWNKQSIIEEIHLNGMTMIGNSSQVIWPLLWHEPVDWASSIKI